MYQISNESVKDCPNCAERIQASAIYCRFCQRGLSITEFKKCPYCAEMIRKTASRCRFCKTDLFDKGQSPGGKGEPPGNRPPHDAPVPRVPINPRRSAEIALSSPAKDEED